MFFCRWRFWLCSFTRLLTGVHLFDAGGGICGFQHLDGLLLIRSIDSRGLRCPASIRLGGQQLYALLPQSLLLLFLDGGRFEAGLTEPLGPLCCEGRVSGSAAVLDARNIRGTLTSL